MFRLVFLVCVVSWLTALPARAQQTACAPGEAAKGLQTLFGATGSEKLEFLEDRIRLTGLVDLPVPCQTGTRISADVVEIFLKTSVLNASGNVVFSNPQGQISADQIEFNLLDGTGVFRRASGILDLPNADRRQFANQDPEVYFYGETVEKLSDGRYRITRGGFSTCVQPIPRWEVTSKTIVFNPGDYAVARNVVLQVKGVPLLYLPAIYYPIDDDERSTGILMPTYGGSTLRGRSWSNAFFWAIDRSKDATFFHDWFTRTGQGLGAEYRYLSGGSSNGNIRFYRFGQRETAFTTDGVTQTLPAKTSYQINAAVVQELARARVYGSVGYFTDLETQQLYHQDIYQRSQSSRSINGSATAAFGPVSTSGSYSWSEQFTDTRNSLRYGSTPRGYVSLSPTRLFGAPVYGTASAEYESLLNQRLLDGQVVSDDNLGRLDLNSSVRVPLSRLTFLSLNSSAAYRRTYYSRSTVGPEVVSREYFSLQSYMLGPVLTKIWDTPNRGWAERMKHVVEPSFNFEYVTDIKNQALIPVTQTTDAVIGNTFRFTYGLMNRVLYRPRPRPSEGAPTATPALPPSARELFSVGIQQTYYSDPRLSRLDYTYTAYFAGFGVRDFSPLALTASVSPPGLPTLGGRVEYDITGGKGLQILNASGSLNLGTVSPSLSFSHHVPSKSTFFNSTTSASFRQGRVTASYGLSWDLARNLVVGQNMRASYSAQCCGIAAEFQNLNYAPLSGFPIPRDLRFNFAFVLAGLGSFSNFFGAFAP